MGGFALTSFSYWVANVNANGDRAIRTETMFQTVIPEVKEQLSDIRTEQKEMRREMNDRFTDIEKRLRR